MIFELCPTLSRDLIKREFLNTAAAFGVLVLLGFAAGMIFPDMAQQTLQNFAAQVEQLGLTDDVPQSQMMATLFFNNITASLLSMLYGLIPFLPLSALALGTNALMLGAFAAIYQQQGIGLGAYFVGVLPRYLRAVRADLILRAGPSHLPHWDGTDPQEERYALFPPCAGLHPRLFDILCAAAAGGRAHRDVRHACTFEPCAVTARLTFVPHNYIMDPSRFCRIFICCFFRD